MATTIGMRALSIRGAAEVRDESAANSAGAEVAARWSFGPCVGLGRCAEPQRAWRRGAAQLRRPLRRGTTAMEATTVEAHGDDRRERARSSLTRWRPAFVRQVKRGTVATNVCAPGRVWHGGERRKRTQVSRMSRWLPYEKIGSLAYVRGTIVKNVRV